LPQGAVILGAMNASVMVAALIGLAAGLAGAAVAVMVRRSWSPLPGPSAGPASAEAELRAELARVSALVQQLSTNSAESFGRVSEQLTAHARSTGELAHTAGQLREALASSKARGQWGERMAEDVLHLAGFIEHINYEKQTSLDTGTGIPDYTFLLPKGHKLFMDVKFPITAYLRYQEATTDAQRSSERKQFLADVRLRVKELARREYATDRGSLTDVLLFIPNETISGFIHEHEPSLFDEALRQHIVFCSPLTLFALLGVVRQAYDLVMVEEQAGEILELVQGFRGQWSKYAESVDKVARQLDTVQKSFAELVGTRRSQLDRAVGRIVARQPDEDRPLAGGASAVAPTANGGEDNDRSW
jgi:DNA recombination protein RmuC